MSISIRSVKCVDEHCVLLISLYLESAIRRCLSAKYILDLYWDFVSRSIQYFAAEHGKQNGGYLLQKQQHCIRKLHGKLLWRYVVFFNFWMYHWISFFNIHILSSTIYSTHIQLCYLMLYCQIIYIPPALSNSTTNRLPGKNPTTSWPWE